jgi:aminoglycoside phosphotransferase (APT) family kinase protein
VTPRAVDELERVARSDFGLEVEARLPVDESFSSTVLSFVGTDGRHYVLKRHWARPKAEREIAALRALAGHAQVPALLATSERDGTLTLLIEGLDGAPWVGDGHAPPALLSALGRSMGRMHAVPAGSFDGMPSWHALLCGNADRYVASIGADDSGLAADDSVLAGRARDLLRRHLDAVPESQDPFLVHFDLRPGNVLVRGGSLVGIIDFEACRGGHPSMDFFKLWQQVPGSLSEILGGYLDAVGAPVSWTDPGPFQRLMQVYAAYHGLAGLGWCHARNDVHGDFADVNRGLIHQAVQALG